MAKVVQDHHWIYPSEKHPEQEYTEPVFKGEHQIITKIQWYTKKDVSSGFIRWLKFFCLMNEPRAIDIETIRELKDE